MSLFTGSKSDFSPPCPRCKASAYVVRVRETAQYKIFDCTRCGPIPQQERKRGSR